MPQKTPSQRRYPDFYERAIPVVLALLAVLILGLLLFSLAVAFGWLRWG